MRRTFQTIFSISSYSELKPGQLWRLSQNNIVIVALTGTLLINLVWSKVTGD